MFDQINIIAFDLDDTLWPCMPTIERAEEALYSWLSYHCPRITSRYSRENMLESRRQFTLQDRRYGVDLSLMRREFLRKLAQEAGYDPDPVAQQAFEVFYLARQEVDFYDDVFPVLERLRRRYRLGAISNGNANVERVGLGHLIEHSVNAAELQIAKPDKLIYQCLAERFGVRVEQILYVGDHPEYDVVGPLEAGLHAVWMNREDKDWPDHFAPPQYQIRNLDELELLLTA